MAIEQLGSGWAGAMMPRDEDPVSLGITAAFAVDPAQNIFAHIATGEDTMHIRNYDAMDRIGPSYIRFDAPDGTAYFFTRELSPAQEQLLKLWNDNAHTRNPHSDEIGPESMQKDSASDYDPREG